MLWAARADKSSLPKLIGAQIMPDMEMAGLVFPCWLSVWFWSCHSLLSTLVPLFGNERLYLCCDILGGCTSFSFIAGAHSLETEPSLEATLEEES